MMAGDKDTIVIIGAGLVGSLSALYFCNRGFNVQIYERNPDPRLQSTKVVKKSINLALSCRGLTALEKSGVDVAEFLEQNAVPMRGRFLHDKKGNTVTQNYGLKNEAINSIDRSLLNKVLLERAEKMPNVAIFFQHKLLSCDFDKNVCTFNNNGEEKTVEGALVVGADGSYSKVRAEMMKITRSNFSQNYIDHGYCELTIPPKVNKDGETDYKMDPNYLHIWPRGSYMMIALPNLDHSFTCTLFMPFSQFEKINEEKALLEFFSESMADSIPLIGKENLIRDYFNNPKSSLVTTKVYPINYKNKAILLGDSAHSMVPFYGQGMNAGFEDVNSLFECFDSYNVIKENKIDKEKLKIALDQFNEQRYPDILAICDMAMQNYIEMRSNVYSLNYKFKRILLMLLHMAFPRFIMPLYTMVSFTNIRYSQAIKKDLKNKRIVNSVAGSVLALLAVGFLFATRRYSSLRFRDISQLLLRNK